MNPKQGADKKTIDRLYSIPGLNYGETDNEKKHLDAIAILSLPKHLRKTAMAIHKEKKATSKTISKITGRENALEYDYLNQLVEMGFLEKRNEPDDVYFVI